MNCGQCCAHSVDISDRMQESVVRCSFQLVVIFDLFLTILIWLMCVMLIESDFLKTINDQVLHYSVQTSLFDIVVAVAVRCLLLQLFYGLFDVEHWCFVALTTTGTCVFLVVKILQFQWLTSRQPMLQVVLILSSFLLAWTEAWLLICRFITYKKCSLNCAPVAGTNERSHLLGCHCLQSCADPVFFEPSERFFTPFESPADSGDEDLPSQIVHGPPNDVVNQELVTRGEEALDTAWSMLNADGWQLKKNAPDGDSVFSKRLPSGHMIFKLVGIVNAVPAQLLDILYLRAEEFPLWNPLIVESKVIQKIDERTDVSYHVSAAALFGMIQSRDFVTLRHWAAKGSGYVSAGVSITHAAIAENPNCTRGYNGPSCWAMLESGDDVCRSEFSWLLNTNLEGWLPQSTVDAALGSIMADYMYYLRAHVRSLSVQQA